MHFLIMSIACSVAVSVLLKLARRHSLDVTQMITVNYVTAVAMTMWILKPSLDLLHSPETPWFLLLVLGIWLPIVFLAMAASVRYAGIVRSDAAQRLSLFIPLLAAFLLFGQDPTWQSMAGIGLALAAMLCLIHKPLARGGEPGVSGIWRWLFLVWLGYGTVDILFKQMAKAGTSFISGLVVSFALAGLFMLIYSLVRRVSWGLPSLLAGALLGVLNFGNILFYIRAHQHFSDNPALVFSSMNIGVVALGTVVGALIFREPLSRVNLVGIGLTLAAIVVMIPR